MRVATTVPMCMGKEDPIEVRRPLKGYFESGRHLVYTVIVGDYDRLKRPRWRPKNVDYVAFTSDYGFSNIRGWRIIPLPDEVSNPTELNRRMKIVGIDLAKSYRSSVYVDGSVQVVGSLRRDISLFLESGCALGVFRHGDRTTPWEELVVCGQKGHLSREQFQFEEERLRPFREKGVRLALFDAGVLMKNPLHESLETVMSSWFGLFNQNPVRDQLSLPIVVWENRAVVQEFGHWTDRLSPTFFRHPHRPNGGFIKATFWFGALCPPMFQLLLKLKRQVLSPKSGRRLH